MNLWQIPTEAFQAFLKRMGDHSGSQGPIEMLTEEEGHKYTLKYTVEPGEWTKEELVAAGAGGCNALLMVSINRGLQPHEGAKNFNLVSLDGYSKEDLQDTEIFQVFSVLADCLSQSKQLEPWQSLMASEVIEGVQKRLKAKKESKD